MLNSGRAKLAGIDKIVDVGVTTGKLRDKSAGMT